MLSAQQIERVRASFKLLAPQGEELADAVFARLLARHPILRTVLPRDPWQRNRELLSGLGMIVKNLHRAEAIEALLMEHGLRFSRQGVTPQQFGAARDAVLDALRSAAGPEWTPELEEDWAQVLANVTSTLVVGAARVRSRAA